MAAVAVAEPSWWRFLPTDPEKRKATLDAAQRKFERGVRLLYAPADVRPHPKQAVFLSLNCQEAFYGGAAGPGKSTALLLAALQYVDVPGYAAMILRRTYSDLSLPGALMDVAERWLAPTNAVWSAMTHTWTFPSKATLTFGHLSREAEKHRYASAEFQFIGWDELTQFTESQYTFLFSRLRRPSYGRGGTSATGVSIDEVPLRMRSASNPGNDGHDWVKARMVDPTTREPGVIFIPARMHENPSLDQAAYLQSLRELSITEQERLIEGDWDAVDAGGMFEPDSWPMLYSFEGDQAVRWWDMAASEPSESNRDPDWTVGLRLDRSASTGQVVITDVLRFRKPPHETEEIVAMIADRDGRHVPVGIEQEPGSAGKALISQYSRHVLRGKASVHGVRATGDKVARARPASAASGRGEISVLRAPWNRDLFSELRRFPNVAHDDQVDCLSAAYEHVGKLSSRASASVPTGRLPGMDDRRAG